MATTQERYAVKSLHQLEPDAERDGRAWISLRRRLDIGAFGVNFVRVTEAGAGLVHEHAESASARSGHEELYVVLSGRATFTVEGEELDAPAGTVVFVRDPAATRKAVAVEAGTTALLLGGRRGEAFVPAPWESTSEMWPLYEAGEYEEAIAVLEAGLERHPGNAIHLYNLACCESLVGRKDVALEHLEAAVAADGAFRENAADDRDLDPLRDDPRFAALFS